MIHHGSTFRSMRTMVMQNSQEKAIVQVRGQRLRRFRRLRLGGSARSFTNLRNVAKRRVIMLRLARSRDLTALQLQIALFAVGHQIIDFWQRGGQKLRKVFWVVLQRPSWDFVRDRLLHPCRLTTTAIVISFKHYGSTSPGGGLQKKVTGVLQSQRHEPLTQSLFPVTEGFCEETAVRHVHGTSREHIGRDV